MRQIIIFLMLMLALAGSVTAYTLTINSPAAFGVSTTAAVDFNITCVVPSGDDSTQLNGSIFWKTTRTDEFVNESLMGAMTNNTDNTISITSLDGDRVWWKASCYDLFGEFAIVNESITLPANNTQIDLGNDTYKIQNITGYVNDTGGAFRTMNTTRDYNISSGLVYLTNASLVGNTSLWVYNYPSSIINQTNSSQRIYDIDIAFNTLSLGSDKVINLTLDTGNIVAKGNVTAANFFGNIGFGNLTGISGGDNISIDGGIFSVNGSFIHTDALDTESKLEGLLSDVTNVYTADSDNATIQTIKVDNATNADTLEGIGALAFIEETELDTEAELETQLTDVSNVYTADSDNGTIATIKVNNATNADTLAGTALADFILETELDTESELETQLTDVSNVYTADSDNASIQKIKVDNSTHSDTSSEAANLVASSSVVANAEVDDDLTISSSGSVDSTALTDGGTISYEWVDAEVSDTLTCSDLVAGSEVVADTEVVDDITLESSKHINTTKGLSADELAGTFTGGNGTLCVWNNGTIYAVDGVCG